MATSYEDSDVYKLAKQMAVEIHCMTLNELPKFEMYEQGSQIRRSSKSIVANFVEGYGRRHYKAEYIKFLTYSLTSCDETKAHLELLNETDSIRLERFQNLYSNYRKIGGMLYRLRQAVIEGRAK
jgi:four helix bundle protein